MTEVSRRTWDGPPKRVRVSYAKTEVSELDPEYRRTRETRWENGGPSSKPKYSLVTDREQYCEGKVKRTPGGE